MQVPPAEKVPTIDFIAPDMVKIPAGSFMMGSDTGAHNERPIHQVMVPAFELARNELTWAEWQLCEDDGSCSKIIRPWRDRAWRGGYNTSFGAIPNSERPRNPVMNASKANVKEYLAWINGRTESSYRLPSEAEWEYATRAGSTTTYYWGDTLGENRANCYSCDGLGYDRTKVVSSRLDKKSTVPVGSFDSNPFGLNDMHGNVREWVADCWHVDYHGAPKDGSAWIDNCPNENTKVVRGGSWYSTPDDVRAANRRSLNTVGTESNVGFRLARTLP